MLLSLDYLVFTRTRPPQLQEPAKWIFHAETYFSQFRMNMKVNAMNVSRRALVRAADTDTGEKRLGLPVQCTCENRHSTMPPRFQRAIASRNPIRVNDIALAQSKLQTDVRLNEGMIFLSDWYLRHFF